jgi:DNA-binding SARP family transcriptional activator
LRDALRLMREIGGESTIWWNPKWIVPLLARALDAGIEVAFVQSLIRGHRLAPGNDCLDSERWPWPVRVYTLGGFRLLIDGKTLPSGGKAQKKPVELLKALVAFGGRDVAEARLADALWPDADGDSARHSLKMALHRLRRLLQDDRAVRTDAGKFTLNPQLCWTDASSFTRLLGSEYKNRVSNPGQASRLEQAIALYAGDFLHAEEETDWLLGPRERLRSRFIHAVDTLGVHLERHDQWQRAVDCYERGIDAAELAEPVYRRLMTCHQRQGHNAEAMTIYERYRKLLAARVGVDPSEQMQALARELRQSPG